LLANFLNQSIAHRDTSVIHGMGKTKSGNESFKEHGVAPPQRGRAAQVGNSGTLATTRGQGHLGSPTKSERPLKTS
jgi:hypothetical protein